MFRYAGRPLGELYEPAELWLRHVHAALGHALRNLRQHVGGTKRRGRDVNCECARNGVFCENHRDKH